MTERQELENAIEALEQQRTVLGDAAVDAALAGLRQKLSALDGLGTLVREEQIARLMPQALAHKIRAVKRVEGERKQVTVLFADLSGYTPLSERLDPEVVMNLSQDLLKELAEAVYKHEGYVAQFMGDAVMAVFGAPLTHEDDAGRAIHSAFAMRERVEKLNRRWMPRLGQPLRLHIGINTGTGVTGSVGSDLKADYAVIGDTTNTAQRLQSSAQRGEILVGDETYRLTRDAFTFEELPPIVMKGKREPVRAYRVLGVKSRFSRGRGLEGQGLSSPLVGRAQELNAIHSRLESLTSRGEGAIVGIIGEAGLGKSRLVAEARESVLGQVAGDKNAKMDGNPVTRLPSPVAWLEGQTLSFGQTISYWPFQQIVRHWAGITEDDEADASWAKLENKVRALFGDDAMNHLPYLASLVALQVQGEYAERVKYLDGDAMGKQIFLTARRFFERLARTQPTVLVFEDLHWMDESSTLLVEHLFPLVETVPLLIIGISRPERETPAARLSDLCARDHADRYTEIRLAPLSNADSAQLIHNLLEFENFPARLRELIVDKADGNPFFLEEVIRTLLDSGAVVRDESSGRWRSTAQIDKIQIPNTLQGVIMARVDRLDDELKQVLRVASVIGRSFMYRVLKATAEVEQRLDDELNELQATDLIREKQHLPELEFMFKHALAQETTYESILLQKRRELHARVAHVIESLFAERLEEFYGLLAYHYTRAEVWGKAQEYLLKAADRAGQLAGDAEALNLYKEALAAYGRAFGDKWDSVQRASVERKIGEALMRRGENTEALEHFYRGLEYLGKPFPTSQTKIRKGIAQELLQQAGHRLLPRVFLKRTHEPDNAAFAEEASLILGINSILPFTNIEGFLFGVIYGLNLSEQRNLAFGIGMTSAALGLIFDFVQVYGVAEAYYRRAFAVALYAQDPRVTDAARSMFTIHELILGKLDASLENSTQAAAAAQETGDLVRWGFDIQQVGSVLNYRGDFTRAIQEGATLVRLGQDANALQLECWGEMVQGVAQNRCGMPGEARAHLERAFSLATQVPDYYSGVVVCGELARCMARQDDFTQAHQVLENGAQLRAKFKAGGDTYTRLVHGQAETYLLQAEQASPAEKEEWLRKANRACRAAIKEIKAFLPGAPEAMLLQGRYEWLRGKPTAAQKWWNKSLAQAERMDLRYDKGKTHFEMGQRLGEREHMEAAAQIFSEIGAELDLARTRKLLEGNA